MMQTTAASNLSKLLLPILGSGLFLFAARRRGLSLREDLGLRVPRLAPAFGWYMLWLLAMAAEEAISLHFGFGKAKPWTGYTTGAILVRVAAIGVAGPIAEELAFRGFLLGWLQRRRLHAALAVVLVSLLWMSLHLHDDALTMAMIFFDGVLLGASRLQTRSLWMPIAMHITGNLYSIYHEPK
jgi:membrane protease YdiL (CAAX protease family)